MGVTVTTNLGLIKPDTDESIQEDLPTFDGWATQQSANMDNIDRLFRSQTGTYTLNWTGDAVNPTLGAGGVAEGKYVRLFPRLCLVYFRILFGGAGFATGSTLYRINLPFAMDPDLATFQNESLPLGRAYYWDNSAFLTRTVFLPYYLVASNLVIFRPAQGGAAWTSATPVVPAQADSLIGYMVYPTQAA